MKFSSRCPIDGTPVWEGEESRADEIAGVMQRADQAARTWRSMPVETRMGIVRRYAAYLQQHRLEIESLLVREVGKLRHDAISEVDASIAKIENSVLAFEQRRSSSQTMMGAVSREIRYRALGVVVVLGPFNFPLHLPAAQIIPALLAGNAVVFKPSERATAIGLWMAKAWNESGVPQGVFQTIVGGADVAVHAVNSPKTKGVFLTGSRRTGLALRHMLVQRYDVMLAMELGGNNPIVVEPEVSPDIAASLVTHSAFVSSGQRCTCARRAIYFGQGHAERQLSKLVERSSRLKIGSPLDTPSPDLGPLISVEAIQSIERLYDQLIERGCEPLLKPNRASRHRTCISPGIIDATRLSLSDYREIGDMEWFGPVLVARLVDNFESAIESASATAYGLSAALLGGTRAMFDRFADEVGAGVVNWNRGTTGAAGLQPFGGLGQSGNHCPAGFFAIDSCNDPVASLAADTLPANDPWANAS
jgi:succinylglutamic semialdehyde dehydrogenase